MKKSPKSKPMANTRKPKTRIKKTAPSQRISNIIKPGGMSPREWQVTLRRQQAQKEAFAIRESDPVRAPGEYAVGNAKTLNEYRVSYYGESHPLNSCSCMDFRTSRIGTCKHLEAVAAWISANRGRHVRKPEEDLTRLYMDYSSLPCPRIVYGADARKLRSVFKGLFYRDGHLKMPEAPRLLPAIWEAVQARVSFRCHDDALEWAAAQKDAADRNLRLDDVFAFPTWWEDVFSKGVKPYPYQREGIEFAARAGRCIIADEMGLGKTIQAIGTAALLHREGFVNSVLVVCPTSLKYQWKREIQNFCGHEAIVIEGTQLMRRQMYRQPGLFKIVSYNALNNDVKSSGSIQTDLLIMDEVQRLKNWDTQIARSARKVRSDYTVVLSGTPLENKLEDLYSIVQLVDQYRLGPYYEFRQEHIICSDSGKVTGYKGLNAVGEQLRDVLLRRRKADVSIQLPGRMDQNLLVPMTREQMEQHEEFKASVARIVLKWRRMHYLSETDRKRLLTFLSQMRMVCDSTYILDQQTRFDTKVEETMNILESIVASGDDKVVIFSGWERMTRLIVAELDKRGIAYSNLYGGVPSAKRKDLMDRFTDDPSVRVFLSTDAGATGLNLQVASYVINLDLPWNPAVLEQRIGRIYRIGQQRKIQVINLVAVGTIEEQMLAKLKFKTDLFDGVLNGGEDEVFLDNNKLETLVTDLGFGEEPAGAEPELTFETVEEPDMEKRQEQASDKASVDTSGETKPDAECDSTVLSDDSEESIPTADVLINQGVAFLGGLVQTLKQPESARRLVDSLVKEDPATGQASINIPVSGKESVLQFVSLLGKLLK